MTGRDDGLSLDAAQGAGGVAQYTAQYIAVKSVAMVRRRRHYLVDRSHAYLQWRWHPARSAASLYGLAGATGWLAADRGRQWQQRWHGRRTAAFPWTLAADHALRGAARQERRPERRRGTGLTPDGRWQRPVHVWRR